MHRSWPGLDGAPGRCRSDRPPRGVASKACSSSMWPAVRRRRLHRLAASRRSSRARSGKRKSPARFRDPHSSEAIAERVRDPRFLELARLCVVHDQALACGDARAIESTREATNAQLNRIAAAQAALAPRELARPSPHSRRSHAPTRPRTRARRVAKRGTCRAGPDDPDEPEPAERWHDPTEAVE